jgi:tetratricopeptide (TPR) repeat protein
VALVALERRAEALEAFCSALAEDERCAPALVNIGNLLLETGHVHDALDYYEAAIRAEEGYAAAHRNRAVALRRLGRRGEAVRALKRAVRLETARPRERS